MHSARFYDRRNIQMHRDSGASVLAFFGKMEYDENRKRFKTLHERTDDRVYVR